MAAADYPHELSWVHQEDVVFKILSTACQDPFCKAACVCKGWNAAMSYAREHHWRTLKRALLGRRAEAHHARMHGMFSAEAAAEFVGVVSHADLDQELRSEIDRLVRSCGTVPYDRRDLGRLQRPKIGGPAILSFDELARSIKLLKAGAGTGAIAAHAEYKRGYPSHDPEDAPLNTAALFVAISASLETIVPQRFSVE